VQMREGFIVDIASYCDRWCEACAFTSHCRVFATSARLEALLDPNLRVVAEAPPLPIEPDVDEPRGVPARRDVCDVLAEGVPVMAGPLEHPVRVSPEHEALRARAERYRTRVWDWLRERREGGHGNPADALSVVEWFHTLIAAKVSSALACRAAAPSWNEVDHTDADGTAKVVLLGIERSYAAWLALVESHVVSPTDAAPFVRDLVWLSATIERVFPNARRFVRPAFDEPDEAARLLANHGGQS
jgi:hypothetical protein